MRDQTDVWNYTTKVIVELQGVTPSGVRVLMLKTKLSKREYKYILSKIYVGAIVLMHMYQGIGGGVQLAEALTWLVLNYEYHS